MKNISMVILTCLLLTSNDRCPAQDSASYQNIFRSGFELRGGLGYLALRDEHISNEKYSGSSSWFDLQWSKYHDTFGYRIGMSFQNTAAIKNRTVSAKATIGSFNLIYQYPVGSFNLFNREVWLSLGPGTDIVFLTRNQNIAQNPGSEQDIYQSGAWLFSLSIRGEAILPISEIFQTESSMQLGLVSIGGGSGGLSKISESMKWLTLFSGLHASAEIGVRYFPMKWVSIKAGYVLDIIRIDSWNYLLAARDNVFLSVGCHPF
jgi:hypothetical protein